MGATQSNIKRVVIGICFHQSKVLMGKRIESETHFADYWEFPGGKVENGETEREALCREFQEELGCQIKRSQEFARVIWDYADRKLELLFHFVELETKKISDFQLRAHSEINWYSLQAALNEKILPANKQIIEKLIENKNSITSFFE